MPMKVKSDQILTEKYDYTLAAGENIITPMKARRNEVLLVTNIACYNPTGNQFTLLYKVMRRRNVLCRLNYAATLNTKAVIRWIWDVYLIDGDEAGIAVTPSTAGDIIEVTFQCLRFRDDEYFKAT